MNLCQALVKPDCTKPKVAKSSGMAVAIRDLLLHFPEKKHSDDERKLNNMIWTGLTSIPNDFAESITFATVEFAGVKFKSQAVSGSQYLKQIENGLIKFILHQMSNVKRLVICVN